MYIYDLIVLLSLSWGVRAPQAAWPLSWGRFFLFCFFVVFVFSFFIYFVFLFFCYIIIFFVFAVSILFLGFCIFLFFIILSFVFFNCMLGGPELVSYRQIPTCRGV